MTKTTTQHAESKIERLKKKRIKLVEEEAKCQIKIQEIDAQIKKEEKAISEQLNGPIQVSEHATLQYLSRISGIPLETVHEAILPPDLEPAIRAKGDGRYRVQEHIIVVKNGVVLTVYEYDPSRLNKIGPL